MSGFILSDVSEQAYRVNGDLSLGGIRHFQISCFPYLLRTRPATSFEAAPFGSLSLLFCA
jgi:hypothetical protein